VVWQQAGERNYHVFYYLLNSTWRDSYGLHSPEDYHFLSQSGCYTIDGVDDAHEFEVLLQAYTDLGFSQEEIIWVFELVATVLQLGNIEFVSEEAEGGQEGSKLSPAAHVSMQYITQLLHVDEAALHHALTHRSIEVRGTVTHIPLKPALAMDSRNALAKSIYGQLFDWLVSRINSSLMGAAKPWAVSERTCCILPDDVVFVFVVALLVWHMITAVP
jgi:myosin heavy subunit